MMEIFHKFAVIGNPIDHSLSPVIHNANFSRLHLDSFAYEKILVEDIATIRNLALREKICGFNVTLPWKEKIVPMLDEVHLPNGICAVNTVAVDLEAKHFVGYNTDIYGILQDFKDKNIALEGKSVLILGYGGLGKTLASIFKSKGSVDIVCTASQMISKRLGVKDVTVANRSEKEGVDIIVNVPQMLELIACHDIIVNAMSINSFNGIDFSQHISSDFNGIFYDCTPMHSSIADHVNASTKGKAFDGRGMLVHQAAKSFEIWTGMKADVATMKKAIDA